GPATGGVVIGQYKIINYHLATTEDHEREIWSDPRRDLMVCSSTANGNNWIARCKCRTGVYWSRTYGKCFPAYFQGPGIEKFQASEYYPERYQTHVLLAMGPAQPGDCGGLLCCPHGVIGLLTGGGEGRVAFADIRDLLWVEDDTMEQ
nr:2A [Simian enterovirus SV4]